MKIQPGTRRVLVITGFLFLLSAAVVVSAQGPSKTPISTAPYDVWTMEQLTHPGELGNYANPTHECLVSSRNVGAAPEIHETFAHILLITGGSGQINLGGQIVTGPDGKKIVQGGEKRKIVVGDVYHIPAKYVHWVLPDEGSTVTYFVCNLFTTPAP